MSAPQTAARTERTPARPSWFRRHRGWLAIGAALVVAALLALLVASDAWTQRRALDPDGPGAQGALALTSILRERGVEVIVSDDRQAAREALETQAPATLVVVETSYLSDDALGELFDASADVILIDPRSRDIDLLVPGVLGTGFAANTPIDPSCDLADAERAGPVIPGRLFTAPDESAAVACYPADGGAGLIVAPRGDGRGAIVDGQSIFVNEHLAEDGNAALALNLLGRHTTLVWYTGSPADSDLESATPSLGELTPAWVTPLIVLAAVTAFAAAVWRGRRFGPLVAERLPVAVRGSETTEGRARLYRRGRDHLHAADSLRLGALGRLARTLGLGPNADIDRVVDAAAGLTGLDRAEARAILVDERPGTDAELLALSDRLRALENSVRSAVRDQGRTP